MPLLAPGFTLTAGDLAEEPYCRDHRLLTQLYSALAACVAALIKSFAGPVRSFLDFLAFSMFWIFVEFLDFLLFGIFWNL